MIEQSQQTTLAPLITFNIHFVSLYREAVSFTESVNVDFPGIYTEGSPVTFLDIEYSKMFVWLERTVYCEDLICRLKSIGNEISFFEKNMNLYNIDPDVEVFGRLKRELGSYFGFYRLKIDNMLLRLEKFKSMINEYRAFVDKNMKKIVFHMH